MDTFSAESLPGQHSCKLILLSTLFQAKKKADYVLNTSFIKATIKIKLAQFKFNRQN